MAGEIKLNNVSIATENAGTVTIAPNNVQFAANHAGIKTALNASGSAPIYACRAWINFNSNSGNPTIRDSGNISSITDQGAGNYDLNLTTAMPDVNGCVVCSTLRDEETVFVAAGRWISSSVITVRVNNSSGGALYSNQYLDTSENVFCAVFR